MISTPPTLTLCMVHPIDDFYNGGRHSVSRCDKHTLYHAIMGQPCAMRMDRTRDLLPKESSKVPGQETWDCVPLREFPRCNQGP